VINITKIFKDIKLQKYKSGGRAYADPVRNIFVQCTPEEEVRQKTILFLQRDLGVPIERISVEESMAHVKRGKRGRADIVVYRDDKKKDALLVIECKASEVDVSCYIVREQAEALPIKAYSYHDILSKDLQRAFQKENYLGDSTLHDIKLFALNFLNLILLKTAINHDDLIGIGVSEDFGVKRTRFLSMIGYYNTQLNVSITNKKNRHHSLQLDLDKFCEYNPVTNMVTVTHNGALSFGRGGSMKRQVVIDYVKDKAPDLIRENKVNLGCIDNSRLLEWEHSDVQNFIKNLLRYGILRDEVRTKYKRK